jgi:hypothetical protein
VTTEQTTRVVPAGWYQDPADDAKVRWWNGITWTEHVESKPAGAAVAAAGARELEAGTGAISNEQRAAEQRELERQYAASAGTAGSGTEAMTRRASIELDHRGPDTGTIPILGVAHPRKPARTGTASAWLLAVTPLITSLLAAVAGYVYFYVTPTPLVAAIGVVLFLLGFLWAVGDSRALQSRGVKAPSPLWGLALPVLGPLLYLVMRRRAVDGSTPLIVFGALLLLTVVAPVALVATGGAQTVSKALEVQLAVREDLVGSGAATSVTCPPIVESIAAGTVFTCDAVLPAGDTVHVWVSFDNEQGQFSWALANR